MSDGATKKLLAFTSVVEIGTGIVVILVPGLVVKLLLGFDVVGRRHAARPLFRHRVGRAVARVLAGQARRREARRPFLGMLIYNAAISIYLGCLAVFEQACTGCCFGPP